MAEVVPYADAPFLPGSVGDRRRLKAIEVGHYVTGGLTLLAFAPMLLLSLLVLPFHTMLDERNQRGLPIVLVGLAVSILGTSAGWLTLQSGRWMAKRQRRRFSVAWSGIVALLCMGLVALQVETLVDIRRLDIDPSHMRGPLIVAAVAAMGLLLAMYAFFFLRGPAAAGVYDPSSAAAPSGAGVPG
jgi:hypothetical protein